MEDPNTGQQMGESDDIINYLYNTYGDGNVPLLLRLGPLTAISNGLALLPRYVDTCIALSCVSCQSHAILCQAHSHICRLNTGQ